MRCLCLSFELSKSRSGLTWLELTLDEDPTTIVLHSVAGVESISQERTAFHGLFFESNITFVLWEPPSNADSTAAHALTTGIVLLKKCFTACVIRLTCFRT